MLVNLYLYYSIKSDYNKKNWRKISREELQGPQLDRGTRSYVLADLSCLDTLQSLSTKSRIALTSIECVTFGTDAVGELQDDRLAPRHFMYHVNIDFAIYEYCLYTLRYNMFIV